MTIAPNACLEMALSLLHRGRLIPAGPGPSRLVHPQPDGAFLSRRSAGGAPPTRGRS